MTRYLDIAYYCPGCKRRRPDKRLTNNPLNLCPECQAVAEIVERREREVQADNLLRRKVVSELRAVKARKERE